MFVLILTLSDSFLAATRALAAELPSIGIDTNRVQEIVFKPEVTLEDAMHWFENYSASGQYEQVALVRR